MSDSMVYPFHMQRKRTAGDVTFGKKDSTGIHISKTTKLDTTGKIIPKSFVLRFDEGGTGFIITPLRISIKINKEKCFIIGLVVTAGHVVCDSTTFKPFRYSVLCYLDNIKAKAIFLRSFMSSYPQEMKSGSNGNSFVYPGDLALLCLVINKSDINLLSPFEVKFSNSDICIGSSIITIGFPKDPEDPSYCCPSLAELPKEEIQAEVNKAFHNFENLVYSEGEIVGNSEYLIDINCAGTNGMSGGPILCNKEIVGVYVGGPPLPGHYQLFLINQLIQNQEYVTAFNQLKTLKQEIEEFYTTIEFFGKLEGLIVRLALLDIEQNGPTDRNQIENFDGNLIVKVKKIAIEFAIEKLEDEFYTYRKYSADLFQKIGIDSNKLVVNFSEYLSYLSQQKGPDAINPAFEKFKTLTANLAYIKECKTLHYEISFDLLQFTTAKVLENEFACNWPDYVSSAKIKLGKEFDTEYTNAIYSMVITYCLRKDLAFNVGISCKHPVFNEVHSISNLLQSWSGRKFQTVDEFLQVWKTEAH